MRKMREESMAERKELKTHAGLLKKKEANKNSKTGIRGVCPEHGKYKAYISFKGVMYVLKRSHDINECIKARREAEQELHGDFLKWYDENYK